MKLAAVIAEYNPFHNGHKHHLGLTRKLTDATHVMVLLSGGFVQRGGPAVADKWTRARMALDGGADLVCELPYIFAGSGAEAFADGAVSILEATRTVDVLSFGSECADISALKSVADVLAGEPDNFSCALKHALNQGMGFAAARAEAVKTILGVDAAQILKEPNNILAVEYLKAMGKRRCGFAAAAVERKGAAHHSVRPEDGFFASAKTIRACLAKGDIATAARFVPYPAEILNGLHVSDIEKRYDNAVLARLSACDLRDIRALPDVSEGMEFAVKNALAGANTVQDIVDLASSKRIPKSRLRRAIAHLIMAATEEEMTALRRVPPYLRVLAMNDKGRDVVKTIKSRSDMPILTNLRANQTKLSDAQRKVLDFDIKATDLQSLFSGSFRYHRDYTKNPVLMMEANKN